MNTCFEVGRICEDLVLRKTQSDLSVVNFRLAVPRKMNRKETDFIKCSAWTALADLLVRYTGKGCRIAVVGRLSTRAYKDKDGKNVQVTELICEDVDIIDFKDEKKEQKTEEWVTGEQEDLPFE